MSYWLKYMNLIIKDAARQIMWRLASAIGGFLVIKLITPYLGPLRFGDYSTILKYFAIRSAFADFGLYVIAMKQLWEIKKRIFPDTQSVILNEWSATKWNEGSRKDWNSRDSSTAASLRSTSAQNDNWLTAQHSELSTYYNKFVSSRLFMIGIVYSTALLIAYLIPSYTSNPYLVRWLPLGMIFSASFMTAGILQIPLQLFRQMKHLSIWLILARIVQIAILWISIYVLYPFIDFSASNPAIRAFNAILISVIASGITQWIYVYLVGKKYLPLKRDRDRSFTKDILKSNRQYGFAYYLSSFHTLIVLILISIFYPTTEWYIFAGVYGLALSLIEILLIIPSALGNSLMHDIGAVSNETKKKRFGTLMVLVTIVWFLIIWNFLIFAPHVINFLWWQKYLSTATQIGSDWILPFLGIVITLSFIKQVFNYLFVSTDLHNKLLWINLFGVVVWVAIGVPLLLKYQLIWWVITQIILEVLFVLWALFVAWKHNMLPNIQHAFSKGLLASLARGLIIFLGSYMYLHLPLDDYRRILAGLLLNGVLAIVLLPQGKRILKQL